MYHHTLRVHVYTLYTCIYCTYAYIIYMYKCMHYIHVHMHTCIHLHAHVCIYFTFKAKFISSQECLVEIILSDYIKIYVKYKRSYFLTLFKTTLFEFGGSSPRRLIECRFSCRQSCSVESHQAVQWIVQVSHYSVKAAQTLVIQRFIHIFAYICISSAGWRQILYFVHPPHPLVWLPEVRPMLQVIPVFMIIRQQLDGVLDLTKENTYILGRKQTTESL